MSYLNNLIGKKVVSIKSGISQTFPFNADKDEDNSDKKLLEISLDIIFEEYLLQIFNDAHLLGAANSFNELSGLMLNKVVDTDLLISLKFDNNIELIVDLKDSAYRGPEAIVLYGPNNLIVVWN